MNNKQKEKILGLLEKQKRAIELLDKEIDNSTSSFSVVIAAIFGLILGFMIAMAIVDDLESFRIPGTDKVFVRQYDE